MADRGSWSGAARRWLAGRAQTLRVIGHRAQALAAPLFAAADRAPWSRPIIVFGLAFWAAWWFVHLPGKAPDFTVFYAVGAPGPIYDAAWLTRLQHGPGVRPFAYPPTLLLLLRPLDLLPFAAAYSVWVAASCVLFVEATGRLVRRMPWLVMSAPVFVFTAGIGQTTLLVGALIVFGMTLLSRPLLAGVLFGVAFSIKPQVMLLLPVALAMRRDWRVLLAMGATGLGVCLASLAFGPDLWGAWIHALREFRAINDAAQISRLGVPAAWLPLVLPACLAAIWFTRRSDDPTRIIAVIGASLLISPHAVFYEKTMLLPAGLALIMALRWRGIPAALVHYAVPMSPQGLAAYVFAVILPDLLKAGRLPRLMQARSWPTAAAADRPPPPRS